MRRLYSSKLFLPEVCTSCIVTRFEPDHIFNKLWPPKSSSLLLLDQVELVLPPKQRAAKSQPRPARED
jgi:hypothetical protein